MAKFWNEKFEDDLDANGFRCVLRLITGMAEKELFVGTGPATLFVAGSECYTKVLPACYTSLIRFMQCRHIISSRNLIYV